MVEASEDVGLTSKVINKLSSSLAKKFMISKLLRERNLTEQTCRLDVTNRRKARKIELGLIHIRLARLS